MFKIKLSTKRQATFPKSVCEALSLKPGDELVLDSQAGENGRAWLLKPAKKHPRKWLACLKAYARNKSHDMDTIRSGIAQGRKAQK